jgi:hypothetical protein
MENMGARRVNGPRFVFTGDSPQAIIDAMMKQGLLIRGDSGWVHSKEVHKHGPFEVVTADAWCDELRVRWKCATCPDQWWTVLHFGDPWPPELPEELRGQPA